MAAATDPFLILKEEFRGALEDANSALLRLENNPDDGEALEDAAGRLHTLQGCLGRIGAPKLGQIARLLEDVLAAVKGGRLYFEESLVGLLFQGMDLLFHYMGTREIDSERSSELVREIESRLVASSESNEAGGGLEALLPDFIAAARDNVEAISNGLSRLEREPSDGKALQEVYRNAHSLKGSALTMGFKRMAKLAHRMEDVLRDCQGGLLPLTTEACDALLEANDAMSVMLDTAAAGKRRHVDVEACMARLAQYLGEPQSEGADREVDHPGPLPESIAVSAGATPAVDSVRVATTKLDVLVNLAGEAAVAQAHLVDEVVGLIGLIERRQRLPLRRSRPFSVGGRGLASDGLTTEELVELENALEESSRSLRDAVENSGRHIETLQQRTMEIRMLPLALLFNTLPRAVRDLSRQFSKKVNFQVHGAATTIDKRILEKMGDPIIHMLRNALDHGIEDPKVRRQGGKPETGTIRLLAAQEGGKVVISLEDDGRGIDAHRLKEAAIGNGLMDAREIQDWTEAQLQDLIFLPGCSTSATVTEVSGRGVGMDVVRANVERLKGQVHVTSELGKGSRFVISLPLSLATVQALMVRCAGEVFAIPTGSVTKVLRIPTKEVAVIQRQQALVYQENILPVRSLSAALGWEEGIDELLARSGAMLVILQSGERRVGFLVEEVLGEQEIVSKTLGTHLKKVPYVAGATILGSGAAGIILDVSQLVWQEQTEVGQRSRELLQEKGHTTSKAVILLVDGHVVNRQMAQTILETAGYRVITAEDGLEALDKLKRQRFDLVVTDIQMPKMDGFSLAKAIRNNERIRNVPVAIMASMEREEDRRRSMAVGADEYLVKGSLDQKTLMRAIEGLLRRTTPEA